MTTKKQTELVPDPLATTPPEPEAPPVKDTSSLEAIIAAQGQQIAELMKAINKGPADVDISQTPFERARVEAHAAIRRNKQRTPEGDADPDLYWVGSRYQRRAVPRGFVPVELATAPTSHTPKAPEGARPGRSALPAGLTVPGDSIRAGG